MIKLLLGFLLILALSISAAWFAERPGLIQIYWLNHKIETSINVIVTSFLIPIILSLEVIYSLFVINKIRNPIIIISIFLYITKIFTIFNGYSYKSKNSFGSPIWGGKELTFMETRIQLII